MGARKHAVERRIRILLSENPLGFNELFRKMKQASMGYGGKPDYFKSAGSRSTLSEALKNLLRKGQIRRDGARKYCLTKTGEALMGKYMIIDHIERSQFMDSYFAWAYSKGEPAATSSAYMFVETKGTASSQAIRVPHMRLSNPHVSLDWLPEIMKCARDLKLVKFDQELEEEQIKQIWEALFKGVEKITVVETLSPQLLLQELLASKG